MRNRNGPRCRGRSAWKLVAGCLLAGALVLAAGCNGDDIHSLPEASQGFAVPECAPSAVVGEFCGGGIVYHDNFLAAGIILVSALADEGAFQWKPTVTSTANASNFDDGRSNIGTFNSTHPASFSCQNKITGGFTDWYLPAANEATAIAPRAGLIGGFTTADYWSSTEQTTAWAAAVPIPAGGGVSIDKTLVQPVRCIRRPF